MALLPPPASMQYLEKISQPQGCPRAAGTALPPHRDEDVTLCVGDRDDTPRVAHSTHGERRLPREEKELEWVRPVIVFHAAIAEKVLREWLQQKFFQ